MSSFQYAQRVNSLCARQSPSAAKASTENRPLIAAVNRSLPKIERKIEFFYSVKLCKEASNFP